MVKATPRAKKPVPDRSARIHSPELRAEEAEGGGEAAHLRGLVESLRADRGRLRLRVLQAASGNVCSKCDGEMQPAPPQEPPAPPTPTNASYVGPYPERERVHAKG